MTNTEQLKTAAANAVSNMVESMVIDEILKHFPTNEIKPGDWIRGTNMLKIRDGQGTKYLKIDGTLDSIEFFPSSGEPITLVERVGK